MNIRVFIALLLLGVFTLSVLFIGSMDVYLHSRLAPLVVGGDANVILQSSVWQDALFSSIFVAIVISLVFIILGKTLSAPIRKIVAAMQSFSTTGTRSELPSFKSAPKEIQLFARAFGELAERVENVHQRDVEISRVKSDFISTAAHQLRTPLTGIRWALEALAKEPLSETQQLMVKNAVDKSHDLVAIVGTLLDISSIESGKHKYTFTNVDMVKLASTVVNDFSVMAGENRVLLYFDPPTGPLPEARADQEQIKWVLNNLIENAIRYTPEGGSVHISFAQVPERVQVLVRDTGIGIQPKDRNNIFERFYRAENAVAKDNKGNGLGLYISRTVATDHGGDLNFSGNPEGPGTTFTLSLPTV